MTGATGPETVNLNGLPSSSASSTLKSGSLMKMTSAPSMAAGASSLISVSATPPMALAWPPTLCSSTARGALPLRKPFSSRFWMSAKKRLDAASTSSGDATMVMTSSCFPSSECSRLISVISTAAPPYRDTKASGNCLLALRTSWLVSP